MVKNKNKIIPQMFDVKPVNQTGDLDWKKIRSVSNRDFNVEKNTRLKKICLKKPVKAYILGVGIENEKAPIFHDPEFNLDEILKYEAIKDTAKYFSEVDNKNSTNESKLILEKIKNSNKEKEAEVIAKKTEKQIQYEKILPIKSYRQQENIKKINEYNHKLENEREATIIKQKKELEKQKALWIEEELKNNTEFIEREEVFPSISKPIFNNKDETYPQNFSWSKFFLPSQFLFQFDIRKSLTVFAAVALTMLLTIGGGSYASRGFGIKERVLGISQDGFNNLSSAIEEMKARNFEGSAKQFSKAYTNFSKASEDINAMGGVIIETARFIPFASEVSSGKNAVEAGKHFSAAGQALNNLAKILTELKNPIDNSSQNELSLLDIFKSVEENVNYAKKELDASQKNIDKISADDFPEDKRDKFILLKQKLPEIRKSIDSFLNNSHIFVDLLGGNGPRKYLFLFQNNSEIRATGGFIGSYGLLDISNGNIKKFFIDGIFNPDGQLKEKVVPPMPIQKISAAWSLHDSNWFPDFPTSARKAIYFYEKTGGPTADGIITFTPIIMQKLLEITGPIEMPEYDVTLDSENFTEVTQYEVEADYDKEENKPKKILSDLAPIVFEKLSSSKNIETASKVINVFINGLKEKQILLYFQDNNLQNIISEQGWSGEIISTKSDYLSVVNTNINGFKTDAVINESIQHDAEIKEDGSIIDTVTITRKHNGGNYKHDWLNKVNADYMRVYVPEGSKLLETSGQTREINKEPLDYQALGFKRDIDVQNEENNTEIDPISGTRIYKDRDKTVFANWVYVSPQETVTITYKYLLPFSLFKVAVKDSQHIDSYSLVAQKQSGSIGSSFLSNISYPENYKVKWSFPDYNKDYGNNLKNETNLTIDRFEAIVFEKNE
ncbi:MAG TPA: DUF4012 domain-containing protein [Candidatus Moranbacteria bacterium]|nr:DUF4012 domain-containing protein [Candidatus Moranbacteria bacterium]HRZ33802.1 DUF4012 domain-containing protein [Candidatus Moranbacteria bacterium]